MDIFGGLVDNFGGLKRPRQRPARPSEPRQIVVCGEQPGVWPDILARAEAAVECLRRRGTRRVLTVGRMPLADWPGSRVVVGMLFSSAAVRDVPALLATGIPAVDLGETDPAAPWPAVPVDKPAKGAISVSVRASRPLYSSAPGSARSSVSLRQRYVTAAAPTA